MAIEIMIVDDHAVVRDGLRKIIEEEPDMVVVGEAANGREAIAAVQTLPATNVILMDIAMPGVNGIEATAAICAAVPGIKVIILSMHNTSEYVSRAFLNGAAGYILKDSASSVVIRAIRSVARGERYLGHGVDLPSPKTGPCSAEVLHLSQLSRREREVLRHFAEGMNTKEVAFTLSISEKTVETYRIRIFSKLNLRNIAELVRLAIREGEVILG